MCVTPSWAREESGQAILPDQLVQEEMNNWMSSCLDCVVGRKEFNLGRYLIRIARRDTVPLIFDEFANYKSSIKTGCLFVFNNPDFYAASDASVYDAMRYLADEMEPISPLPAEALLNGAALNKSLRLNCPVTGIETVFDDFDCIAFCPQAENISDPLYDPLMAAPFPCVNMTSDVYAFSLFVRETAQLLFGEEVYRLDCSRIKEVFDYAIQRFHRLALSTIRRFAAKTDVRKCPVHVEVGEEYWVAAHQDPAFAETVKECYRHELPKTYGPRLIQRWQDHFEERQPFTAAGVSACGSPTAGVSSSY